MISLDDDKYLTPDVDPEDLRVNDVDVRKSVFVVPVDAPVPSELGADQMPSGTLYRRLAALDESDPIDFAFVPVSGAELLALDRVWRTLQRPKKIYALFDLPGAKYDVLFTQAVRQIGIPRIEWPSVSEALASRTRTIQRTNDSSPWVLSKDLSSAPVPGSKRSMLPTSSTSGLGSRLPVPVSEDEDN